MKNPLTPAGIEPATFRFLAQHLNHCATAVPPEGKRPLGMRKSAWEGNIKMDQSFIYSPTDAPVSCLTNNI